MRKKMIVIDRCYECPHSTTYGGDHLNCFELDRDLDKKMKGEIPEECPLDDYKEGEE
jgi:hypothetical protein